VYSDGTKIPIILAGDFNSEAGSGVYEFLSTGHLQPDHPDFLRHTYGKYTSDGLRHKLGLKNAYGASDDLKQTNYTSTYNGVLDHIWYGSGVAVNSVLAGVDATYLEKVVGFPNVHFPSDHICIVSEFRVKPQRDTTTQPTRPPPVFPSSNSYLSKAHA